MFFFWKINASLTKNVTIELQFKDAHRPRAILATLWVIELRDFVTNESSNIIYKSIDL